MFQRLPASHAPRMDPRGAAFGRLSFLVHISVAGSIVLCSWLALPSIPLPRQRPHLVTPVVFSRAGAPAPKLGSRTASPLPPDAARPPSPAPRPVEQPREISQEPPGTPPEPSGAEETGVSPGPGDPDGVPEGDLLGMKGGACVGEDCDPDGPVGLGPGPRGGSVGIGDSRILRPGISDVTAPILVESSKLLPRYPEAARRAGVTGRVILEAVIQADGRVASVVVLRETPPRLGFAEAAAAAVTRWRYLPATQNGRPVAVYFTVIVEFTLAR